MQQRFLAGWTPSSSFSFDEGVMPSTYMRNTTRIFMPDKPHRYGTKIFMMCDSRSAYCHIFELYAGKRAGGDGATASVDNKTGAAAVIRNLKIVLDGVNGRPPWHVIVIDRFYSSVVLAVELLRLNVYVIGTVMTNLLGFNKAVKESRKTRPANIPRGSFTFSRSVSVPSLIAFHWWDRKPVHYLGNMASATIGRKVKQIGDITVAFPAVVSDYQRGMGGVDVHDQLCLQRYSLQMSTKFVKYYKSLFLGFVDLALVNSYISHRETARIFGSITMSRCEWYRVLQNQLLQLRPVYFAGVVVTPLPTIQKRKRAIRVVHAPEQSEAWVTASGIKKRHQRSCKVCALLRTNKKKKSFATTYFCERCSLDDAKLWLGNKIRREYKGQSRDLLSGTRTLETGKQFHLPWVSELYCVVLVKRQVNARKLDGSFAFEWEGDGDDKKSDNDCEQE
ncbi:LOW QUALITY PROTEIN: hypothetical protein PHMEG_00020312 [Phytophthora megakarya]|uniref:PiggyBac transposable element-derived protein domain-containing protein n=1 Tax=Phytophthora megakarya TaxID=4795 RepID=A0A225VQK9_9STRA|nr:LOW QUALITY PROTEIN: hypothetical protein PHMEG_00020312 [Phytophthora megakarya]